MGIGIRQRFYKNITDSTVSHIHQKIPAYRIQRMAGFIYWLPSLLVVLILKETGGFFDACSELKREIDYVKKMNNKNELLVFECQVSRNYTITLISIRYSYKTKCITGYYIVHVSSL